VVDFFLLVLIELFFASSHSWGAMSGYWSKSLCSKKGVGHIEHKFHGAWRSPTNDLALARGVTERRRRENGALVIITNNILVVIIIIIIIW